MRVASITCLICNEKITSHDRVCDGCSCNGATTEVPSIRARITRQQQRIVTLGEQIGVLMLALEVEEDFLAELLVLEESEFEERENFDRAQDALHEHYCTEALRSISHVDESSSPINTHREVASPQGKLIGGVFQLDGSIAFPQYAPRTSEEREECEAEEHEQAMVDRANAHVDRES